jgi:large subunit ribosomal protein L15
MQLHQMKRPVGANKRLKRVGRGESSGHGKTSSRGGKGQSARTGKGKVGWGFEGGQTPMYRRMPKRGFTNVFRQRWAEVNLDALASRFQKGATVDIAALIACGLASKSDDGLRVLGRGELSQALTITANHVTESAKQKIEAAGGSITLIKPRQSYQRDAEGAKTKVASK